MDDDRHSPAQDGIRPPQRMRLVSPVPFENDFENDHELALAIALSMEKDHNPLLWQAFAQNSPAHSSENEGAEGGEEPYDSEMEQILRASKEEAEIKERELAENEAEFQRVLALSKEQEASLPEQDPMEEMKKQHDKWLLAMEQKIKEQAKKDHSDS